MKKVLLLFILITAWKPFFTAAQQPVTGKPVTELFVNYHQYINNNDSSLVNGFAITRAYLGYNFMPEGNFTGSLLLNLANPTPIVQRRSPFFREASVSWSNKKLTMTLGMTSTRGTMFQQRFVGKRYISESFEIANKYTEVADLGFAVDYIINDMLEVDFTFMNGEGYNKAHIDNSIKTSAGINIKPNEKFLFRAYFDVDRPGGIWQSMLVGFAGFKSSLFSTGIEAARKTNLDLKEGHDSWGLSITAAATVTKNTELFGRYDYTTSAIAPGEPSRWNYLDDYRYSVIGLQYTFNNNFRMALNYQGTMPYAGDNANAIFINGHFKF
ncbi:MAG TPA: hypothetical protein VK213_12625 [Bacteroidales bacterium]|nr:hypothetical protein [Bacteroidales bacterium]